MYFCDVCERMVGSAAEYKQHVSEHATCGIDGCSYTAHQDILEKHIMHQHLTGFYNRIVQGNSPEDIEKWRQERRKNFPTKMKIAEKILKKEMMKERGEVMHLKREKRKPEELIQNEQMNREEAAKPEQEWHCTCKARQLVENMPGRGRGGRGGRARIPRDIRHQKHCRELEMIRERMKVKQEKNQAFWDKKREERRRSMEEKENRDKNNVKRDHENDGKETPVVVKKIRRTEPEDSCSDEEGWNDGLMMFKGTVHMERERMKIQEEKLQQHTSKPSFSSLVAYDEDDDDSDDEAPVEVKTVVSYDNVIPDEPIKKDDEPKSSKKPRKRRKKQAAAEPCPAPHTEESVETTASLTPAEEALLAIRSTIQSHIESFEPTPSTSAEPVSEQTQDMKVEEVKEIVDEVVENNNENIPDDPAAEDEFVQEPLSSSIKLKQDVPVVFKKRLRHPTLLERLLLSEIKNERNTILQCVRYVCKNNFFLDNNDQSSTSSDK